jgi:hypothetical protein
MGPWAMHRPDCEGWLRQQTPRWNGRREPSFGAFRPPSFAVAVAIK